MTDASVATAGDVMADPADKTPSVRRRRRQRAALLAVIAGLMTATAAGFVVLILSGLYGLGMRENDTRTSQAVFLVFTLSGITMSFGGWRLMLDDPRGYKPTVGGSLVAFLLAVLCVATWILRKGTFDYSLIGLTVPLVTYGAIAYVLMDCPPNAPATDGQQIEAADKRDAGVPSDPLDGHSV